MKEVRQFSRWIRLFLLATLTLFTIVSCQNFSPSEDAGEKVTVRLSGWGSSLVEQRLLQQVINDFEQQHPNIRVKLETIADQYMDVVKTRLIGDAAPDVFYLDALEAPFLMAQDVLEPLDSYIKPDFEIADFEPNLLNIFKHKNKIYGFPKDYSTLALFYSKKAFAEAGITAPPATWEELIAISKQLTIDRDGDGKPEQYGLGILPELPRLSFMIRSMGGKVVAPSGRATFADEKSISALNPVIEQYQNDRTSVRAIDIGANSGSEMFGQGRVAMVLEGNWMIPYLRETFPDLEYGTAEVPQVNNQPGTMVYTVAYVMDRQSRHKPEAWELISYLTGKEGMDKWTGTGFALPTRKSVAAKQQVDRDVVRSPLVAGVKYATPWQVGDYPTVINNQFNNQFLSALLGEQPLEQAMQKAQQDANEQIRSME
ncbi:ABC transporter substrate-binding protein [Leptolyngbya ohadii]|uniref:ABC transporter substrate-binding protein n=1 Tax=Leptolyngbya ohadii TaxID=1962290 RepID=UPI0021F127EB|nr:ABC transporter substrate-binding protein [Leptolyngbya ohadii]